jgi:phosphotriesterase-related protein
MSKIRTVTGDIDARLLGITYPHEHLLTDPPTEVEDDDLRMGSVEAALQELASFQRAGGRAIVEMTPRDYGRMPEKLRIVSQQSGVHVIATSGWHKDKFSRRWVESRSVNDVADEIIREVEEGIDQTGVRAGVIKAASSLNQITPSEEKSFRAAARANLETGATITTHTEAGTMGLEQIELLKSEGVSPERVIIGHVDRNLDWDYHVALLNTGATMIYDQISKEKYYPDSKRVEFIIRLVAAGYGKQIMLSGDMARRSYWPSYGAWGGPGLTYILWRFVPWLVSEGLASDAVEDILIHTPARMLSILKPG